MIGAIWLPLAVYTAMLACTDASPGSPGGSAAPVSALDGRLEAVSNEHQQGGLLLMQGRPGWALGDATSVGTAGCEAPYPPESAGPTTELNASPARHPMSLGHEQQQSSRQDLKTRAGRDGEAAGYARITTGISVFVLVLLILKSIHEGPAKERLRSSHGAVLLFPVRLLLLVCCFGLPVDAAGHGSTRAAAPLKIIQTCTFALYFGTARAWSPHLPTSRPQNEAVHDAGLRPHHAAGQSDHDPLLFQHRYQHHDAKSGHLLYYQYEAKRHAHVVMLSELGVTTCTVAPSTVENTTAFSLFVPSGAKSPSLREALKPGVIVVGDDDLICKGSGSVPLISDLREKVLNISSGAEASGGEVVVVTTVPAAVHECFEYSQLELFRGKANSLHLSRTARLDSLSAHGYGPPPEIFASTEQIVQDAKAATIISVTDPTTLKARLPSTTGNGSVLLRPSRKLGVASIIGKPCGPCNDDCGNSNDGDCDDGGEGSSFTSCDLGQDCSDCGTRIAEMDDVMSASDCFFRERAAGSDYPSLKPDNTYTLEWTQNEDGWVRFEFIEVDPFSPDDSCGYMQWEGSRRTHDGYAGQTNEIQFTMPDLCGESYCPSQCSSGTYPEFYIRVEWDTTWGTSIAQSATFRLLEDYGTSPTTTTLAPSSNPVVFERSSADGNAELRISCTDCAISATADLHVLVRTTDTDPFDESWTWGDFSLDLNVDVEARAWTAYERTIEQSLMTLTCPTGVCFGATLAGISVNLGMHAELDGKAEGTFDAEATFKYKRKVSASGKMAMHTKGWLELPLTHLSDFTYDNTVDPVDSDEPTWTVQVDATAKVTLIPRLYVGLFASGDVGALSGDATVYVGMSAELIAQARFQFQTSSNGGELSAVDCSTPLLGCSDSSVCGNIHDTQLHLKVLANFYLAYKVYARAEFGSWEKKFCIDSSTCDAATCDDATCEDASDVDMMELNWEKDVLYMCWYLFPPSPSPPPPLPSPSSSSAVGDGSGGSSAVAIGAGVAVGVAGASLLCIPLAYFVRRHTRQKSAEPSGATTTEMQAVTITGGAKTETPMKDTDEDASARASGSRYSAAI